MTRFRSRLAVVCFLVLHVALLEGNCEDAQQSSQFFGGGWPTKFEKNSQTLPSIEVKLSPPEDPLPQVSAMIQLLERTRIRLEEGLMAKLEDEYNKQLDSAQTQIMDAVSRAMKVFDDPGVLKGTIQGAISPLKNPRKASKATEASFVPATAFSAATSVATSKLPIFRELDKDSPEEKQRALATTKTRSAVKHHNNGPIAAQSPSDASSTSFLEMKETSSSQLGGLLGLDSEPSVKIQLSGVKEPDKKVKQKMEEIEQKRVDEETKMIEQAVAELTQLTKITIQELEKNIQIQMNEFLVDTSTVATQVQQELPKKSALSKMLSFRELSEEAAPFMIKKCLELKEGFPSYTIDCSSQTGEEERKTIGTSFLQVNQAEQQGLGGGLVQQLNVKFSQSDKPYPTIDELVNDMEKKRDATERLERMKVLELELKLLKAQDEMIKDALHTALARVLAQYGPVVDTIKTEIAVKQLRD